MSGAQKTLTPSPTLGEPEMADGAGDVASATVSSLGGILRFAGGLIKWVGGLILGALSALWQLAAGAVRLGLKGLQFVRSFTRKGQQRRVDRAQRLLDRRGRAAKRWARGTIRAADRVVADAEVRAADHVKAVESAGALHVAHVKSVHDRLVSAAHNGKGPEVQAELARIDKVGDSPDARTALKWAKALDIINAENKRATNLVDASQLAATALGEAKSAASAYTANVRSEADKLKKEVTSAHNSYARATDANMHALEQLGERRRRPRVFREGLKSITQDQASHRSAFTGSVASGSERLQNAWSAVPKDTTRVDNPSPSGEGPDKPLMEYSSKNPSNRNWFSRARSATLENRATRTLNRNQKRNKQRTGPTR